MLLRWSPLGGRVLKKGRHGLDTYWLQMLLYQLHYHTLLRTAFSINAPKNLCSVFKGMPVCLPTVLLGPQTCLALGTTAPYPNHRYYYLVSAQDSIARVAYLFDKNAEDIIKLNKLVSPWFFD
jgi:hypothetical protein